MDTCKPCAETKAKQKSLLAMADIFKTVVRPKPVSNQVNEGININISNIKSPDGVRVVLTNPLWLIIVDERIEIKWYNFSKTKNGMVDNVYCQLQKWKDSDMPVKNWDVTIQGWKTSWKSSNRAEWRLSLEFEYMARDTPQKNILSEVIFVIIGNRGRVMMISTNIIFGKRYKVFKD